MLLHNIRSLDIIKHRSNANNIRYSFNPNHKRADILTIAVLAVLSEDDTWVTPELCCKEASRPPHGLTPLQGKHFLFG